MIVLSLDLAQFVPPALVLAGLAASPCKGCGWHHLSMGRAPAAADRNRSVMPIKLHDRLRYVRGIALLRRHQGEDALPTHHGPCLGEDRSRGHRTFRDVRELLDHGATTIVLSQGMLKRVGIGPETLDTGVRFCHGTRPFERLASARAESKSKKYTLSIKRTPRKFRHLRGHKFSECCVLR
jgi:hypothetical protein